MDELKELHNRMLSALDVASRRNRPPPVEEIDRYFAAIDKMIGKKSVYVTAPPGRP